MQLVQSLRQFALECRRVLRVTKKPSNTEFMTIIKVSGLGILAIGLMGFLISLLKQFLFK